MGARLVLLSALLASSLFCSTDALATTRRLVVQVSSDVGQPAPSRSGLGPERRTSSTRRTAFLGRLEHLGLVVAGSLAPEPAGAIRTRPVPRAPRSRSGAGPPVRNPFALARERIWLLEASDSLAAAAAAKALARDPAVEWVELDQPREAALVSLAPGFPGDPMFRDTRQWGLWNAGPQGAYGGIVGADVHALQAWQRSTGSNDVLLAIADTGIDPDHPELGGRLPEGGPRIAYALNVSGDPTPAVADSHGHGTAVTGVMAARTGEGSHFDSLGIAGVCGGDGRDNAGCRIVPIKISPGATGTASSFSISRAILHAADVGARAVNISFTGGGKSRLERLALYDAMVRGCVTVAAIGNRGDPAPQYPAAYAADGFCIAVGATDPHDRRASFSSYGPGLDLMAPGVNIWTTIMTYPGASGIVNNGYVVGSGTSFAAPFVAGAVGLLAAARPDLMEADFQRILRESADDVGVPGVDAECGFGRLDAARALAAVDPAIGIWHDEVAADRFANGPIDSLFVGEPGPGTMGSGRPWPRAQRVEASVRVALPDSFLDPVRVWPRVGGTMTVRGDFLLAHFAPWAEAVSIGADSFTLRGFLYRAADCAEGDCPEDSWLPVPPDQARFGFTVIGPVDHPPSLRVISPEPATRHAPRDTMRVEWKASDPDRVTGIEIWLAAPRGDSILLARLPGRDTTASVALSCPLPFRRVGILRVVALDQHGRKHDRTAVEIPISIGPGACIAAEPERAELQPRPNPFRGAILVPAPWSGKARIIDVTGRIVRRTLPAAGPNAWVWDGREDDGSEARPGLYFIVHPGDRRSAKVLKLE